MKWRYVYRVASKFIRYASWGESGMRLTVKYKSNEPMQVLRYPDVSEADFYRFLNSPDPVHWWYKNLYGETYVTVGTMKT